MAIKWIHEEVLQRYIRENPRKWRINGKRVLAVEYNIPFNEYPDLYFTVEGGDRIPVEVEWTSRDFDHDVNSDKFENGWIFVLLKNMEDSHIGAPQYEVSQRDFVRWVKSNAEKLATDSIASFQETYQRKTPKLWIQYIGARGNAINHYDIALERQTWGIPAGTALNRFKKIQKNDLIMFVIQGTGFGGRVAKKTWHKRSFAGKFRKIQVFRITKKYYESSQIIWPRSRTGQIWPHRFDFDAKNSGEIPFLNMKNLIVKKMATKEKEQLRTVVSANFIEGDHSTLVDCMHCSEQAR